MLLEPQLGYSRLFFSWAARTTAYRDFPESYEAPAKSLQLGDVCLE